MTSGKSLMLPEQPSPSEYENGDFQTPSWLWSKVSQAKKMVCSVSDHQQSRREQESPWTTGIWMHLAFLHRFVQMAIGQASIIYCMERCRTSQSRDCLLTQREIVLHICWLKLWLAAWSVWTCLETADSFTEEPYGTGVGGSGNVQARVFYGCCRAFSDISTTKLSPPNVRLQERWTGYKQEVFSGLPYWWVMAPMAYPSNILQPTAEGGLPLLKRWTSKEEGWLCDIDLLYKVVLTAGTEVC